MNVTAAAATTAPVRQWSRLLKSSSSASTSLIISHGSSSTIWTVWSVSLFHYSCRSTITPKQWVSCSKYATSTFDFSGRDRFGVQSLRSQGHGASYASLVASVDDSGPSGEESDGAEKKSKNQKKREARKAVKWAMDLANFTPSQIKKILRVASLDKEVYDALLLVKRLGADVREGKRRQFAFIGSLFSVIHYDARFLSKFNLKFLLTYIAQGRLLRDVDPKLMDALIQASKDNDNNKIMALSTEETWSDEEGDRWVVDEEETDSEEQQTTIDTAKRWLHGLISKDPTITNEVYSLHNVDFDRQELRKRVRSVHNTCVSDIDGVNESAALTKSKNSLLRFLRVLAKQCY